jgi:hypothetical protein
MKLRLVALVSVLIASAGHAGELSKKSLPPRNSGME